MFTPRFLFAVFLFPALFIVACNPKQDCQTNDPAPEISWQTPVEGTGDFVIQPFVYDNYIYTAFGLDNTRLVVYNGDTGYAKEEIPWDGLRDVDDFIQEGDYLYWTHASTQNILRCHLPSKQVSVLGTMLFNPAGYNEGLVFPFEGLIAGLFHEKTMTDRDYALGVFDMASQEELFRYAVDNDQLATHLGEPAIGRTTGGDTIVTFVESTLKKLMIFNLSTQDSIQVTLPPGDFYIPTLRNIHIRDGRIFLALHAVVYCFDAASGSEIWKMEEGETSKVCHLRFWNERLIFHSNAGNIYSLDPATGNVIWKKGDIGWSASDQTVLDNILYFTTYSVDNTKRDLTGLDLDTGCLTTFISIGSETGALIGVTVNGALIFESYGQFHAYRL